MNPAVTERLAKAKTTTVEQELNIFREMIQEIVLLGLWRSKFFEKAAFYGGTSLRILYGLNRFSEDLDFTLLAPLPGFNLAPYEAALQRELAAFGFETEISRKEKKPQTKIESAFIKANTMIHLLKVNSPYRTHSDALLKVKIEVDIDPPADAATEAVPVFWPIPYSIKSLTKPCLFAGKLHACLCRSARQNIKGRDWYDFLWYIAHATPVSLKHLQKRMEQSGHWPEKEKLTLAKLQGLLKDRIAALDFERLKADVRPFINQPSDLDAWDKSLFNAATDRLVIEITNRL